jgi:hypothetical protein
MNHTQEWIIERWFEYPICNWVFLKHFYLLDINVVNRRLIKFSRRHNARGIMACYDLNKR